jgi:cytoskeleton protein RodZ
MDVGQTLRQRREALGYTLEEVQAATKIRLRYLQAIEAGRAQDLPGPVYTRGFIRSYANFLELDGTALAAAWGRPAETDGEGSSPQPAPPAMAPPPPRTAPNRRPAIIALWVLALLAIAAAALAIRGPGRPAGATAGSRAPATPTAAATAKATATATSGSQPAATPTATASKPTVSARSGTDASGNPVTTYTVAGASDLTVTVLATARCWFDVTVDGTAADPNLTLLPGDSRTWRGSSQVAMRIGFPPGASLSVDGVPIPAFQGQSPVNVAFVLGH